jgi:coenzyme F420 hydrogenase subunit beta
VDDSVYQRSQSGGAVTALLLALMQEGRIGGAVTVVMAAGTPPRPAGLIGRNRDDLLAAQGSKYCPVPILSTLKVLEGEGKPVALVCLGCHVHGLRNILERNPDLGKKVGPVIGLICDRVMASSAIDYLVWRSGINHREKSTLEYRSKKWRGYPGDVRVVGETDKESFLPDKERKRIKDFFTPARCRLCFDKMNVLSDVTVGDPWGIDDFDKARGESVIIARTQSGLQAVKAATRTGYLDLREIPYEDVLRGQGIDRKRKEFEAYCREWASMDRPLPEQSESVLGSLRLQRPDRKLSAHFHRAFTLDHYSKKVNMFRDVRKWLRKRRLLKKIEKTFRPLYSVALLLRRKQP